jgi:hypothetical protein
VALEAFLSGVPGAVADHITVQIGARYAQRAVTTAGFVWDVGETEAQVVRRFAGRRDVVISVFAVAKGNQAPSLGMIASPVVEKHGSVHGVAV